MPTIDSNIWLKNAWRNRVQSLLLLAAMVSFLALLGWLLWGSQGIWILMFVGVIGVLFNPSVSPRLVMRLYGAKPIVPQQAPVLWRTVNELSRRAGVPAPALYYLPSRVLNAFAVGTPNQAGIAVSDGLLRNLEYREMVGVLAHEISHVRNNDLWVMGLADLFSRATNVLSLIGIFLVLLNLPLILFSEVSINWLAILLLVFAPTLSALAQLALSRTREFDADLGAVWLSGEVEGLASALIKIEQAQAGWIEHIFMPGRRMREPSLLRTHPDTDQRIERLLALRPSLQKSQHLHAPIGPVELNGYFGKPVLRSPRWHINGLWH